MRIQLSALVGIHSFHHMIHRACKRRHKLTSVLAESTSCAVAFPSEAKSGHAIPGAPDPAAGLSAGTGIARLAAQSPNTCLSSVAFLDLATHSTKVSRKDFTFVTVRREQGCEGSERARERSE